MFKNRDGKNINKSSLWVALPIVAISFIALYFIVNLTNISSFVDKLNSVLSPIFIGLVIAYLLNPIFSFFENKVFRWNKDTLFKRRLCRLLSLFFTLLVFIAIFALFILLIVPQLVDSIIEIINNHEHYIKTTIDFLNGLIASVALRIAPEAEIPQISYNDVHTMIHTFFQSSGSSENPIVDFFNKYSQEITSVGTELLVTSFSFIADFIVGIFIAFYILSSKELRGAQIKKARKALFTKEQNKFISEVLYVAKNSFGGYIRGKLASSFVVGLLTFICLLIFDISDYKVLIATIICITDIIPFFGPFIGAIPSALIVLMCDPTKLVLFIIIILVIQQIEGNIVSPKILGESTNISSLAVIIAITVMGSLFGVIGMIIGVPVFATVIIVVNNLIEKKLKAKGLPTDTNDYMGENSMSDIDIILHNSEGAWIRNIKKVFKKNKKNTETESTENNADSVNSNEEPVDNNKAD